MYQHTGKCENQQNLKDILDSDMVLTTEEVADDITNVPMTSTPVKKPSARKSLCLFTSIFDVKKKTENILYQPGVIVLFCVTQQVQYLV